MNEQINLDFDKFQKELEVRDRRLKNFVNFSIDDECFLELTSLLKNTNTSNENNRRDKDSNNK